MYESDAVKVYYINLDRSKDRLNFLLPKIKELGFESSRIEGIEGRLMSDEEINKVVDIDKYNRNRGKTLAKGEVGCYLGHLKAWERFQLDIAETKDNINQDNFALILEDDVDFDSKLLKETILELIENKKLWDIVYFQLAHKGTPLKIKELNNNLNLVVYLTNIVEAGAYLINTKTAKALSKNALPITMPLDYYYIRNWEHKLIATGIEPRIVEQKMEINSLMTETKQYIIKNKNLKSIFYKKIFNIQAALKFFMYNLKNYFYLKFHS